MLSRRLVYSVFLMLISPAISLLIGLRDSDVKYKKWLLIAFITIYGSIINLAPGSDGFFHQSRVYEYYLDLGFNEFVNGILDILTLRSNVNLKGDLYIHLVSYLAGGILAMPKMFFVIVSFVFGYFYSSSIFKVIQLTPKFRYNWVFYGFISVFVLWKGIEGINTVRTWTGLWVLFYGILCYYEKKKLKYLILIFLPPFIHIGYFVMTIPAWFVLIFGVRPKIYSVLFFLSFFLNLINPETATSNLEEFEVGKEKVKGYYVEEEQSVGQKYAESQSRGAVVYKSLSKSGLQFYAVSCLGLLIIIGGYYAKKMTNVEAHLFSVGILTKTLSSSSWFLFALANRTAVISGLFILAPFIMMAQRGAFSSEGKKYPRLESYMITLIFISLIPYLILRISDLTEFVSIFTLSTPFVVWLFEGVNISIKDGFKDLFNI